MKNENMKRRIIVGCVGVAIIGSTTFVAINQSGGYSLVSQIRAEKTEYNATGISSAQKIYCYINGTQITTAPTDGEGHKDYATQEVYENDSINLMIKGYTTESKYLSGALTLGDHFIIKVCENAGNYNTISETNNYVTENSDGSYKITLNDSFFDTYSNGSRKITIRIDSAATNDGKSAASVKFYVDVLDRELSVNGVSGTTTPGDKETSEVKLNKPNSAGTTYNATKQVAVKLNDRFYDWNI